MQKFLSLSTDRACKSVPKRAKKMCARRVTCSELSFRLCTPPQVVGYPAATATAHISSSLVSFGIIYFMLVSIFFPVVPRRGEPAPAGVRRAGAGAGPAGGGAPAPPLLPPGPHLRGALQPPQGAGAQDGSMVSLDRWHQRESFPQILAACAKVLFKNVCQVYHGTRWYYHTIWYVRVVTVVYFL